MSQTSLVVSRPNIPLIKPVNREIELKFLVSDSGFKATQQWPALGLNGRKTAAKRLRTVYFDTVEGDLKRQKMVLRMRSQRRGYVMALKWSGGLPGGMFERGEIEIASPHDTPDPAMFGPEAAAMLHDATGGRELAPIYATDIRRMTYYVRSETSDIEVAFDSGSIVAGETTEPVREIEMELKAGDVADLYRLGMSMAELFPVRLGNQAKSDRGALLAAGKAPEPVRASTGLSGTPTVDEAIGRGMNGCLAQFTANWPAFEAGDAVTAIHQMRVSMRRLRAMLGLFHRSFPCAEFLAIREEAKHIASIMGEARNLDVFLDLVKNGPLLALPTEPGFDAIIDDCTRRRDIAYDSVRDLLASPSTTKFVLSTQAFIARYGWRNILSAEALPRLTVPAQDFASQTLARLHYKLLKRGRHLAALSPHERHQLRISLKKLRYAADLFSPLYESKSQTRSYLKDASALQDQLGLLNDLAVAHEMVDQLGASDSRAAGIILGWCSRGSVADGGALKDAWRVFRKTRLFWE